MINILVILVVVAVIWIGLAVLWIIAGIVLKLFNNWVRPVSAETWRDYHRVGNAITFGLI